MQKRRTKAQRVAMQIQRIPKPIRAFLQLQFLARIFGTRITSVITSVITTATTNRRQGNG